MKTVCIVGAGPSGLVAAKILLHHQAGAGSAFSVTVFDAQPNIGGLWPMSKDDTERLIHPLMVTNQSKHTIQFSDLAWENDAPELPRAWQVGQYLERYMRRYCSFQEGGGDGRFHLRLGWKVEQAVQSDGGLGRWTVHAKSEDGVEVESEFDYLLVASGFFGQPAVPHILGIPEGSRVSVIHSSRYRDLETLLPNADGKGGKILIVGGQMSGVETAATIASHISSAANSPGPTRLPGADKYSIHHVIQRPIWVLPLFTSPAAASTAARFIPLDIASYNLSNRPQSFVNTHGHIDIATARTLHSIYQGVLGTDQSNFSPLLASTGEQLDEPPYLAISDWYMDFVRSGLITLSQGKLESVSGTTATISPSSEQVTDIAAIVLATGFEATPSISFLSQNVHETLSLDPTNLDNTITLAFHGTHHPDVPNLGFVGFYRSPYWGVMEMQARFLAEYWAPLKTGNLSPSMQEALDADTSIQRFMSLRGDPRVSQFPMGDYPFLMQEFAAALEMEISPPAMPPTPTLPHNSKPMDILTPARYSFRGLVGSQKGENEEALRQTHDTAMAGLTKGKFVARAVFRSLLGEWRLERDLVSKLPSHPSGQFSGTAKFLLREGTKDGRKCADAADGNADEDLGLEYLYIEEGDFKASNGMTFRATRRYIWRYDEKRDVIGVWFVKTGDRWARNDPRREDDQKRADYLFHEIGFIIPDPDQRLDSATKGWAAKSDHLCVEDFYDVVYQFAFNAVNLKDWRIGYTVKGPQKDYTIDGVYTRKT